MKQIIILETNPSEGGLISIRVSFWLPVPDGQAAPLPQLAAAAWRGASDEEIAALQAGTIVEEVRTFIFPVSLGEGDVHKILQIAYTDRLEYLQKLPPKGQYYGAFFDGAQWTEKA
jgi:hypothetical protein